MFAQLPEIIKQEVLRQLENNDFRAAKELHDKWSRTHSGLNSNKNKPQADKHA